MSRGFPDSPPPLFVRLTSYVIPRTLLHTGQEWSTDFEGKPFLHVWADVYELRRGKLTIVRTWGKRVTSDNLDLLRQVFDEGNPMEGLSEE